VYDVRGDDLVQFAAFRRQGHACMWIPIGYTSGQWYVTGCRQAAGDWLEPVNDHSYVCQGVNNHAYACEGVKLFRVSLKLHAAPTLLYKLYAEAVSQKSKVSRAPYSLNHNFFFLEQGLWRRIYLAEKNVKRKSHKHALT